VKVPVLPLGQWIVESRNNYGKTTFISEEIINGMLRIVHFGGWEPHCCLVWANAWNAKEEGLKHHEPSY
jgi:hypothetical protein